MDKKCNNCRFELYNPDEIPCKDCDMNNWKHWMPKTQTNADRIRAMSDEELALLCIQYRDDWGDYCTHKGCYETQKEAIEAETEWLKQPAK